MANKEIVTNQFEEVIKKQGEINAILSEECTGDKFIETYTAEKKAEAEKNLNQMLDRYNKLYEASQQMKSSFENLMGEMFKELDHLSKNITTVTEELAKINQVIIENEAEREARCKEDALTMERIKQATKGVQPFGYVDKMKAVWEDFMKEEFKRLFREMAVEKQIEKLGLGAEKIAKFEEWSGKKFGDVIFDSDKDDWSEGSSTFDRTVINKRDLLFIVYSYNDVHFGFYCASLIDKYDGVRMDDDDTTSFAFSFNDDVPRKFEQSGKTRQIMHLYNRHQSLLFGCGHADYNINKRGEDSTLARQQQDGATFDYQGLSHPFTGESGNYFTHKRVVVVQMK